MARTPLRRGRGPIKGRRIMSKAFNEFHDEIMKKVIEPKLQILASQGNFSTTKDFFNQFRQVWDCSVSDNMLRRWMKELGYELVVCTELVSNHKETKPIPQPEALPLGEDGFDNEAQTDWAGGIINGPGVSSRKNP